MERTPVTNRIKAPHQLYSREELEGRRKAEVDRKALLARRAKIGFAIGVVTAVGAIESLKAVVGALDRQAENTPQVTRLADTPPAPSPEVSPASHLDK